MGLIFSLLLIQLSIIFLALMLNTLCRPLVKMAIDVEVIRRKLKIQNQSILETADQLHSKKE